MILFNAVPNLIGNEFLECNLKCGIVLPFHSLRHSLLYKDLKAFYYYRLLSFEDGGCSGLQPRDDLVVRGQTSDLEGQDDGHHKDCHQGHQVLQACGAER